MEDVHFLEADGTEVYGIYKHDVCYMEKDGIQRTLQMIVPEMKPDKSYVYPAILYVQGSAWMKQDNYKRLGVMAGPEGLCDSHPPVQGERPCLLPGAGGGCQDRRALPPHARGGVPH